jgi:hypothetical protein
MNERGWVVCVKFCAEIYGTHAEILHSLSVNMAAVRNFEDLSENNVVLTCVLLVEITYRNARCIV